MHIIIFSYNTYIFFSSLSFSSFFFYSFSPFPLYYNSLYRSEFHSRTPLLTPFVPFSRKRNLFLQIATRSQKNRKHRSVLFFFLIFLYAICPDMSRGNVSSYCSPLYDLLYFLKLTYFPFVQSAKIYFLSTRDSKRFIQTIKSTGIYVNA